MNPTPVERAAEVSRATGLDLFVKRDDQSHPALGGSKWRKLDRILPDARAARATDLVTIGSAASNHVVSTAVHGGAEGLRVHAVLLPHPDSPEARAALAAMIAAGAELTAARRDRAVPLRVARIAAHLRLRGRRPYFIAPGGSSALGAASFIDAARELADQIAAGALPGWPDLIACAVGSGGMLAGLAAGLALCGSPSRLIGVKVREGWATRPGFVSRLAHRALRTADRTAPIAIEIIDAMGPGYGRPSPAGERARALFAADGLQLDPTYTAKAAAALLDRARQSGARTALFWHSYAPPPAPRADIPADLAHLLVA